MPSFPLRRRRTAGAAALLAGVAALAAPAAAKSPRPLPDWSLEGTHIVAVDPGFVSLEGTYDFVLDGTQTGLSLTYDAKGRLVGGGGFRETFFSMTGTTGPGPEGSQTVQLYDPPKRPVFDFDGVVSANGRDLTGELHVPVGWGGLTTAVDDPQFFVRRLTPSVIADEFVLQMQTTMDRKGVVRGARGADRREVLASLTVYGGRKLEGGRVRGKVTTSAVDPTTSATVRIVGRGWSLVLTGPVDEDGFHALGDLRAPNLVLDDVPITLAVVDGPEPPPPPPPPPPRNLLTGGVATFADGQIHITRSRAPSRFFGTASDITVDFPQSGIGAPMTADSTTASTSNPRRFYAKVGARTYGTAPPAGNVTLDVTQFTGTAPGTGIRVVCTGTVSDPAGRTKPVDVILEATFR